MFADPAAMKLNLGPAIRRKGMTQSALADEIGVNKGFMSEIIAGKKDPSFGTFRRILEVLDITPDEAFEGRAGGPAAANGDLVPIYNVMASAGHGSAIDDEEISSVLAFPEGYLRHITQTPAQHLAVIGVKGDSMAPTLNHDDIVMLDRSKRSLAYDGLFVLRYDEALHVKRVSRSPRPGHILVISDNRGDYPPFEVPLQDVQAVGKVIWYGRKV